MAIGNIRYPVADSLGDGFLQRPRASLDRDYGRAEQLHPLNVRSLPTDVLGAHVNHAFKIE